MEKTKIKKLLKWGIVFLSAAIILTCAFLYKSLLVDAENLRQTSELTENNLNETDTPVYTPPLTTFPKQPQILSGGYKFIQNIGGSGNENLIEVYEKENYYDLIFESDSNNYDVKNAGINLARVYKDGLIDCAPLLLSKGKYLSSCTFNNEVHILTDEKGTLVVYKSDTKTTQTVYTVKADYINALLVNCDSSLYLFYQTAISVNAVDLSKGLIFQKSVSDIKSFVFSKGEKLAFFLGFDDGSYMIELDANLNTVTDKQITKNEIIYAEYKNNGYYIFEKENDNINLIKINNDIEFTIKFPDASNTELFIKDNGFFYVFVNCDKPFIGYYAPDGSEESRNNTDFSNIINIRKAIFSDNKTYFLGSIKDGAGQIKTVMLTLYGSLLLNTKILTSYGNSQAGHFSIEENYATFIITSNSSYAEYKQNNGQKDLFILCTVY